MTYLALNLSHYVNGVAKKHGEVSRLMFARYQIDSITNGVHAATWACAAVPSVFDRYIPDWRAGQLQPALRAEHSAQDILAGAPRGQADAARITSTARPTSGWTPTC